MKNEISRLIASATLVGTLLVVGASVYASTVQTPANVYRMITKRDSGNGLAWFRLGQSLHSPVQASSMIAISIYLHQGTVLFRPTARE